jgi:DNA polymerase III subunit delta'
MGWEFIHGHEAVRERLSRAFHSGRLGHAYLFVGASGIGKKMFARELAKALLCEGPSAPSLAACDRCAACHLVDANTHPDLQIIGRPEDKHDFPIALMRDLCTALALKPARGKRRVAIVDDADDFSDEAANCFLKSLEEPPPFSLLILISADPERQFSTIRSRCQIIPFGPLPDEFVKQTLNQAGITDPSLASRSIRLAAGSPGTALAFASKETWSVRQQLIEELLNAKPGGYSLARTWMERIESAGKDSASQRAEADKLMHLSIDVFRQALNFATSGTTKSMDTVESKALDAIAKKFEIEGLLDRIDRLLQAEAHNRRNVQLSLLVEAVVDALLLDKD